jgi:hypothetical protein
MNEHIVGAPIPLEVATQLCAEIRREFEEEMWPSSAARWCWSCQQSVGENPESRGFLRKPGNRGCILVNARYQEELYPL